MGPLRRLSFDYDGVGTTVEGLVLTDETGAFSHTVYGLSYGQNTIRYRVQEWDLDYGAYRPGAWVSKTFTMTAPLVAEVSSLTLASHDGEEGTTPDPVRSPLVVGQLESVVDTGTSEEKTVNVSEVGVEILLVETTYDSGGVATETETLLGKTRTDFSGAFNFAPVGLAAGGVKLRAKAYQYDTVTQASVYGASTDFEFTLQSATSLAVTEFGLVDDTGETETEQADGITKNPTLKGQIKEGTENAGAGFAVEIDHGDGSGYRVVYTAGDGSFYYRPTGLAAGTQTIQVRALLWDSYSGATVAGVWSAVTFELEATPQTLSTVSEFAVYDTGTIQDGTATDGTPETIITSDARVSGTVVNADGYSVGYLTVEVREAGASANLGSTTTDY